MWLAWPPMPFTTPIILVALVPLLFAIDQIASSNKQKKGKKIFFTAALTFTLWNAASTYWIYNAINAYNDGAGGAVVSALVCLVPFCLGASLLSFAVWLFYRLRKTFPTGLASVALIATFISMEYLQQVWDLAFPWMTLGNSLAGMHQLAQWYEYTGVYGGSFWILLSNVVAYAAIRHFRSKQGYLRYRTAGIWALVVCVPVIVSIVRYKNYVEIINPSNIVVVQPNVDPYAKYESLSSRDQAELLMKLSDSAAKVNTEYFIWPETAIPNFANEDRIHNDAEYLTLRQFLYPYKNGTILTGMETVKFYNKDESLSAQFIPDRNLYVDHFNAAVQIENSSNVQFYHKSKLVPGVEKMPFPAFTVFLKPVFAGLGGTVGGWGWQENPGVFYSQSGIGVAPAICYESLWGEWIGRSVKEGAQFIAIITNDGWWGNTSGKDQHLLYAKLRAIETRRYVARSANTGISAIINQRGDLVHQTKWWTRTAINANINLNSDITLYVKSGDYIAKICVALTIGFCVLFLYRKWWKKPRKTIKK